MKNMISGLVIMMNMLILHLLCINKELILTNMAVTIEVRKTQHLTLQMIFPEMFTVTW